MPKNDDSLTRDNLGFLLAKAMQKWNSQLTSHFKQEGYAHARPSFGSILLPLFEEDGLRLSELARRGGISKQTMTTMIKKVEAAGLITQRIDPKDARAQRVYLTEAAHNFAPVASRILKELEDNADALLGHQTKAQTIKWLQAFIQTDGKNT